jgi:uncharacterized protein
MMPGSLPIAKPPITPESQWFWEGIQRGEFLLRRCAECDTVVWYPRRMCNNCASTNLNEFKSSGRGTIYTYTINYRGEGSYRESAPYVLAYVELEEGPRVLTNVVESDLADVAVGAAVEVVFERSDENDSVLYRFKLT